MKSKEVTDAFHKAQRDCGNLSFELGKARKHVTRLEHSTDVSKIELEDARNKVAALKAKYDQADAQMIKLHPVMKDLDERVQNVEAWVAVILSGLIGAFAFPLLGAVAIHGGLAQLIVGLSFALTMKFLFGFAIGVSILMGDSGNSNLIFCVFVAMLIALPMAVIGFFSLTGMVTIVSVLNLALVTVLAVVANWFVPTLVRKVI